MSVKIEFDTDNAAFEDFAEESKRILMDICEKIDEGYDGGNIKDCNGNTVGKWSADY